MEAFCQESIQTGDEGRRNGQKVSLDLGRFARTQDVDNSESGNCCLAEYVRLRAAQAERRWGNRVGSLGLDRRIYVYIECALCRVARCENDARTLRMNTRTVGQRN